MLWVGEEVECDGGGGGGGGGVECDGEETNYFNYGLF